jgi:hypothetical protein
MECRLRHAPGEAAERAPAPPAPPLVEVPPDTPWPSNDAGVVFRFETASFRTPISAFDKAGEKLVAYSLTARGRARYDRNFALVLSGGSYVAERAGAFILEKCRASGALTIEALVTPCELPLDGPRPVISFASSPEALNFCVAQEGNRFTLDLRTSIARGGRTVELCTLASGAPCHLVVTYAGGVLVCCLNGAAVLRSTDITGDFSGWGEHELVLGALVASGREWPGTLEGIALYDRAISAEEAAVNSVVYHRLLQARAPVHVLAARAKLVAKTVVPDPESVLPYTRILVAYEYEIEKRLPAGKDPRHALGHHGETGAAHRRAARGRELRPEAGAVRGQSAAGVRVAPRRSPARGSADVLRHDAVARVSARDRTPVHMERTMMMRRHTPRRLAASGRLAALVLPGVIALSGTAQAGTSVAATIRALTGRTTRLVWVRGTDGKGDAFGPREGSLQPIYRIVALDTDDGGRERYLVPQGGTNSRPLITPSGGRVVWSDCDRIIWVIDWDGTNRRQLCKAEVAVGVAEDPPGTDWVYVAEGTGGGEGYASIVRYQIDNPRTREVAWDKSRSIDKWEISRDGTFGASRYPATVGSVTLPNGEFLPVAQYGCTPGISGDGTTVMHMITVSHAGIYLYNRDGSNKRVINFGNGPSSEGLRRAEYWWAAFARYDGRFITFGGPFTKLGGYPCPLPKEEH